MDKEIEDEKKNVEQMKQVFKNYVNRNKLRPDVPGWFL